MGLEQEKEPRYQVTYHTYLASGGQLSYTPSAERVVRWRYVKHSLLILQIFAIFQLRHAHVRKDTRLSPLFRTSSDGKLGRAWERDYHFTYSASECRKYSTIIENPISSLAKPNLSTQRKGLV